MIFEYPFKIATASPKNNPHHSPTSNDALALNQGLASFVAVGVVVEGWSKLGIAGRERNIGGYDGVRVWV